MEGKRFSPVLTVWLRDNKVKERLKDAVLQGRREVFLKYITSTICRSAHTSRL